MDLYTPVVAKLNELAIPFQLVEHPPALTTDQADSFIEGIEGVRTKTMFLTNKKKKHSSTCSSWMTIKCWTWINLSLSLAPIVLGWLQVIV